MPKNYEKTGSQMDYSKQPEDIEVEQESMPKLGLLQIEPTTRCNLNCNYCIRKSLIEGGSMENNKDIETEKVLAALEQVKGRVETILYQGLGEPMLCRDLPKLLDAAHEIGAETTIITNGTIFRKEVLDRCDSVTISIDSLRSDYNIRKGTDLSKVKENISKIRSDYPDLPLLLEPVVSKENIGDLEQIADFAQQVGARVRLLSQIGDALPQIDNADISKIEALILSYPDIIEWSRPETLATGEEHPSLNSSLFIDVEGNVSPSCYERENHVGKMEELDGILDRIMEENIEIKVKEKLENIWQFLSPLLGSTHDKQAISQKLWECPELQKRGGNKKISEFVSLISQYVSENPSITSEDFVRQSLAILKA